MELHYYRGYHRHQIWVTLLQSWWVGSYRALQTLGATGIFLHYCLSYFSVVVMHPDQGSLQKERFFWGLQFQRDRTPSPLHPRAWWGRHGSGMGHESCYFGLQIKKLEELSQNSLSILKTQSQPPVICFFQQDHTFPDSYQQETKYSNAWDMRNISLKPLYLPSRNWW